MIDGISKRIIVFRSNNNTSDLRAEKSSFDELNIWEELFGNVVDDDALYSLLYKADSSLVIVIRPILSEYEKKCCIL